MPEPAERSAERKRLGREAARRREAVGVLRIIEATARYAAEQMGGADPALARSAALEAAAEMDAAAMSLRRLMRLDGSPAERRSLVRLLAERGMSGAQIAATVGRERPERAALPERRVRPGQARSIDVSMPGGSGGGGHGDNEGLAVKDDHERGPAADAELTGGGEPG